jgi:hypothetical protein
VSGVRSWVKNARDQGYLGMLTVGTGAVWLARSLPLAVSLLLGLSAGLALLWESRWEARSERNRRLENPGASNPRL